MIVPDAYSLKMIINILADGRTVSSPGPRAAETGTLTEGYGGLPFLVSPGSTTPVGLGTITRPKFVGVWGDEGISFKTSGSGDEISANPFAFIANISDGMDVVSLQIVNADTVSHNVIVMAAE